MQLASGVSYLALIARYADRCRTLHGERLRAICDADANQAERLLRIDLSQYLLAAGVSPLIDASVGEPRRELLVTSFYVEAKQYTTANPGIPIQRAFAQAWGTWGRLRKLHPSREAFLVVFRRNGRLVELPPMIAVGELTLYAAVADIAHADDAEPSPPVQLSEASLMPGAFVNPLEWPVPARWVRRTPRVRRRR